MSNNNDPLRSHWDEDPVWPLSDWQYEVANGDTRLGYHDWVRHNKEAEQCHTSTALDAQQQNGTLRNLLEDALEFAGELAAYIPGHIRSRGEIRDRLQAFRARVEEVSHG